LAAPPSGIPDRSRQALRWKRRPGDSAQPGSGNVKSNKAYHDFNDKRRKGYSSPTPLFPWPGYNQPVNWLAAKRIVRAALEEDLGAGDITTELALPAGLRVSGSFVAKGDGVLCGGRLARAAFAMLDRSSTFTSWLEDGEALVRGAALGRVECSAAALLGAERVALNLLQRLSGIASSARRCAERAAPCGIRICETRKTTPGLRVLEKYAVRTGGGFNHRVGLDSAVLLKDNHFALSGRPAGDVLRAVRAQAGHALKLIAEAQSPAMCAELAAAGADVVLLDNFTPAQVREAVALAGGAELARVRQSLGLGRVLLEVSGGVGEANLDDYLLPGVDVISSGALTHSVPALDISLEAEAL
jgi:nicotinate-nucleotide pyrophosphorylase (carboxylating)